MDDKYLRFIQSIKSARESMNYAAPEIMYVHVKRVIDRIDALLEFHEKRIESGEEDVPLPPA